MSSSKDSKISNKIKTNPRACAALAIADILTKKHAFNPKQDHFITLLENIHDKAFAADLCYGTLRNFLRLKAIINQLVPSSLKEKDFDVFILIALGIYQLGSDNKQEYATVNETVNAAIAIKKPWAKNLINAVLRNFIRKQLEISIAIDKNLEAKTLHPLWLINKIEHSYKERSAEIFHANNTRAPLSFRINTIKTTIAAYLQELNQANLAYTTIPFTVDGFQLLSPIPSYQLPRFNDGHIIIQDSGAQLAVSLLAINEQQRILDACAAPGNKTAQIFAAAKNLSVIAIEQDLKRTIALSDNLIKYGIKAHTTCCDVADLNKWWDKQLFDRILLDVPCSATGVMRRHPEIRHLRTAQDIADLVKIQQQLLIAVWPTLKVGGHLLYVTCSILPEENSQQIAHFLQVTPNAQELPIVLPPAITSNFSCSFGHQLLPQINGNDGMYFCKLIKLGE